MGISDHDSASAGLSEATARQRDACQCTISSTNVNRHLFSALFAWRSLARCGVPTFNLWILLQGPHGCCSMTKSGSTSARYARARSRSCGSDKFHLGSVMGSYESHPRLDATILNAHVHVNISNIRHGPGLRGPLCGFKGCSITVCWSLCCFAFCCSLYATSSRMVDAMVLKLERRCRFEPLLIHFAASLLEVRYTVLSPLFTDSSVTSGSVLSLAPACEVSSVETCSLGSS